jgi:hypothetical protein
LLKTGRFLPPFFRQLKIQRKNPGSALRAGQCYCRVTLNPKPEGGKKGLGFNLVSFQKTFQNFGFLSLSPTALGQSPEILEVSRELGQKPRQKVTEPFSIVRAS